MLFIVMHSVHRTCPQFCFAEPVGLDCCFRHCCRRRCCTADGCDADGDAALAADVPPVQPFLVVKSAPPTNLDASSENLFSGLIPDSRCWALIHRRATGPWPFCSSRPLCRQQENYQIEGSSEALPSKHMLIALLLYICSWLAHAVTACHAPVPPCCGRMVTDMAAHWMQWSDM